LKVYPSFKSTWEGNRLKRLKVTTIVGTRPEVIRLSETIKLFEENFDHRLIHTGQNSNKFLKEVFFEELKLRNPDLELELENTSLSASLATIFLGVENDLKNNRPDAVVVLGDTNSALAAIIARRLMIPVYHLEGGNRSFDSNVPEEVNRRIIDHTADYHMVYSEHARRNLENEGIHPRNICLIGSPMREVIKKSLPLIMNSSILVDLNLGGSDYFLVSIHRQENIDSVERLNELARMLNEVALTYNFRIILSTHPRMKNKLVEADIRLDNRIELHQPFSFFEYCKLQASALICLSDSGSISEEAAVLEFKAITLRDSMERPEALEAAAVMMAGINSNSLLESIRYKMSSTFSPTPPPEYLIEDTSERVVNFLLSTVHNHNFWSGLRN
jgi:UDP-N-acetylglucosamine 2-epimerase